jgi:REP element-mobilizing transposase RayT
MSADHLPNRKHLRHDVPLGLEDGSLFFITVNCAERGRAQLTPALASQNLLDAALFYHERRHWHIHLFLLMPDHWHAIMGFPRRETMEDLFRNWKRYTSRTFGIAWQDGFFDHRLRNDLEVVEKHHYIEHNPVRRGLCAKPEDWPHQMHWSPSQGKLIIGA